MQKFTADDPETKSADVVADNVEALKELFPDAFTEGKVDFDVLKQLLGGAVDERDEKYGLNWHGKRAARQIALTPSTGTLRPCPEESVDWDTTQNLMIEGDNLEVLKLLQKSYTPARSSSSTSTRRTTRGRTSYTQTTSGTASGATWSSPGRRSAVA
jgi:adenine-specific DNA-methyltransferase